MVASPSRHLGCVACVKEVDMSREVRVALHGEWESPLAPADMAAKAVRIGAARWGANGSAFWIEGRAAEAGRVVLVERTATGVTRDWTPPGFSVRSRVHEYGGGEYWLSTGTGGATVAWFVDFATQRVFRQGGPSDVPVPVTPDDGPIRRFADGSVVLGERWVVAVRERHEGPHATDVFNEIVVFPADGSEPPRVLCGGDGLVAPADFVASPAVSPDGQTIAWVSWDHPNMPWDSTTLWTASFDPTSGTLVGSPRAITDRVRADNAQASLIHPAWGPDGALYVLTDSSGWWNLARVEANGSLSTVVTLDQDLCGPFWGFAPAPYGFLPDGSILIAPRHGGNARLATVHPTRGATLTDLTHGLVSGSPSVSDDRVLAIVGRPNHGPQIVVIRVGLPMATVEVLREADTPISIGNTSTGEPISFPTTGGSIAHATYYAPRNASHVAPAGTVPPLIVLSHGGPTGATSAVYSTRVQFWTSRGFAVVDVDYRGSTGYGRLYREALRDAWGVADVDDCVAAATYLAEAGLVDRSRLAIMGGSAGGYTTLACLAFRPGFFAAGMSDYGIGDLEALAAHTHKFEARYLDRLIAPYPSGQATYRERSPLHHVERIETPMLILQGEDDRVVPPEQARSMAEALDRRGVAHALVVFAGEGHGFRAAKTITTEYGTKLSFLGKVFGFVPAGEVADVEVRHLNP
jgi:dipeptidyl aminopeptidase/acylaminoacyl peptidase